MGPSKIYTTDMDELLEIAKSGVTRQLTAEEKERYGYWINSCLPSNKISETATHVRRVYFLFSPWHRLRSSSVRSISRDREA